MKYVVDVPDNTTWIQVSTDRLEPYTEPDRSAIEDEVWGLAKKLISMSGNEVSDMMGCTTNFGEVMYNMPYQEAKAKYEEWKKQKDEIRVGDEVKPKIKDGFSEKGVVLRLYQPKQYKPLADVLWHDETVDIRVVVEKLVRTGRHFDEIEELLKKMKEG